MRTADVVICGAGIAGVAAAYHLCFKHGVRRVVLVDERNPLTLTSDKSTECYRNYWPGPDRAMVSLMNRSIDIMEELSGESGDIFRMNRRGYLYATADPTRVATMRAAAERAWAQGAGPLREDGHAPAPDASAAPHSSAAPPARDWSASDPFAPADGADLLTDRAEIRRNFPYLSDRTLAVLHVRRAGWLSGQQLGMYLLERAQARGAEWISGRVTKVELVSGTVAGVTLGDGTTIATSAFVNAAGPFLKAVGKILGLDLPVFSERHAKLVFDDVEGVIPRGTPLLIWSDPQRLSWSEEERAAILSTDETRWMLGELPAGAHLRPEGGRESTNVLMLWAYDAKPVREEWPLVFDPAFAEIVLRGLSTMLPGLRVYSSRAPRPLLDGGYYTRTRENRPLVGRLPVKGAYVIGALSGFGIMAACGAGELLAANVTGSPLPDYAPAFDLGRYAAPDYQSALANWSDSGQL